jgi:hypothetical protein
MFDNVYVYVNHIGCFQAYLTMLFINLSGYASAMYKDKWDVIATHEFRNGSECRSIPIRLV